MFICVCVCLLDFDFVIENAMLHNSKCRFTIPINSSTLQYVPPFLIRLKDSSSQQSSRPLFMPIIGLSPAISISVSTGLGPSVKWPFWNGISAICCSIWPCNKCEGCAVTHCCIVFTCSWLCSLEAFSMYWAHSKWPFSAAAWLGVQWLWLSKLKLNIRNMLDHINQNVPPLTTKSVYMERVIHTYGPFRLIWDIPILMLVINIFIP